MLRADRVRGRRVRIAARSGRTLCESPQRLLRRLESETMHFGGWRRLRHLIVSGAVERRRRDLKALDRCRRHETARRQLAAACGRLLLLLRALPLGYAILREGDAWIVRCIGRNRCPRCCCSPKRVRARGPVALLQSARRAEPPYSPPPPPPPPPRSLFALDLRDDIADPPIPPHRRVRARHLQELRVHRSYIGAADDMLKIGMGQLHEVTQYVKHTADRFSGGATLSPPAEAPEVAALLLEGPPLSLEPRLPPVWLSSPSAVVDPCSPKKS